MARPKFREETPLAGVLPPMWHPPRFRATRRMGGLQKPQSECNRPEFA